MENEIVEVIDNFLPLKELDELRSLIINDNFPFYVHRTVSDESEKNDPEWKEKEWNWYATHMLYNWDMPNGNKCQPIYDIFIPRLKKLCAYRSLIRIKVNFYPRMERIEEHRKHVDYPYDHYGAIFALNTCNGFTRFHDGTKIESVENRFFIFKANQPHNSSTTSNSEARYNINFNFL